MCGGMRDHLALKVLERHSQRLCPSGLQCWLGDVPPWARGAASPGSDSSKGESFSPNTHLA